MLELLLCALAVGALYWGHSLGIDTGRRQVLQNLTERIDNAIKEDRSEFSAEYGVRGSRITLDYLTTEAKYGTGFNSRVDGQFVVANAKDFERLVNDSRRTIDDEQHEPEHQGEPSEIVEPLYSPSPQWQAILGSEPITNSDAIKKVFEYVGAQNLKDKASPININCDDVLFALTGERRCTMFKLSAIVRKQLE
jgi:chromatin remodeling complex protein RSC6